MELFVEQIGRAVHGYKCHWPRSVADWHFRMEAAPGGLYLWQTGQVQAPGYTDALLAFVAQASRVLGTGGEPLVEPPEVAWWVATGYDDIFSGAHFWVPGTHPIWAADPDALAWGERYERMLAFDRATSIGPDEVQAEFDRWSNMSEPARRWEGYG